MQVRGAELIHHGKVIAGVPWDDLQEVQWATAPQGLQLDRHKHSTSGQMRGKIVEG